MISIISHTEPCRITQKMPTFSVSEFVVRQRNAFWLGIHRVVVALEKLG